MAQEKKVKWALGNDEPEDLQEFLDNDDIVKKNKGSLPPKGTYTFAVKRLAVKPNKNDDDRISVMLIMKEPKKGNGAPWNGYLVWDGFNVTEQGAPFIKRFLKSLGLTWKQFMGSTKKDNQDPPHITQIGGVKFEKGEDPTVRALVKIAPEDDYNDAEHLEIARYLPLHDDDGKDEDTAEDAEVVTSLDDGAEAEPEGQTLTLNDLNAMDLAELQEVADQAGIKAKKTKGLKKKALRELIIEKTNLPPF